MGEISHKNDSFGDVKLLKLAREISMDIRPVEEILKSFEVSSSEWDEICTNPTFKQYMRSCIEEWASVTNTQERVRLKSLAFVEEALPEFYARAHDSRESLAAKTEILKTVAKFAGVGAQAEGVMQGEKMVVTINLGSDHQLKIERDVTPQGNDIIEG